MNMPGDVEKKTYRKLFILLSGMTENSIYVAMYEKNFRKAASIFFGDLWTQQEHEYDNITTFNERKELVLGLCGEAIEIDHNLFIQTGKRGNLGKIYNFFLIV